MTMKEAIRIAESNTGDTVRTVTETNDSYLCTIPANGNGCVFVVPKDGSKCEWRSVEDMDIEDVIDIVEV